MHIVDVFMKSTQPYSQSRPIQSVKPSQETHDDFENRVWKERMHSSPEGKMLIPPGAFKNALSEAAKRKSMKIPGQRNATYTKCFESGVMVVEPLLTTVDVAGVQPERLFVPADGVRGSGKRVWKNFPFIPSWSGSTKFYILDDLITESIFVEHLKEAGNLIGIGRFRPKNNGYYGRFEIVKHIYGEAV